MISDITLGQFFPGFSAIHKLDPRTKILLSFIFIVSIFIANSVLSFLVLTFAVGITVVISRISFKVILKGIKPIIVILLFTAILNLFLTSGEGDPLIAFWGVKIYTEGIARAFMMAYRVILLIVGTSILLTYTTSPIALTDGLESLLAPLKKIGIPIHLFAMMMSIALRFIPTLVEETEKIMNAQKSRGADFSRGGLVKRAKALIPILIPLFVSSFKRADELATAMECRCYRGDKNRTKLVKLTMYGRDYLWLAIYLLLIAAIIALAVIPYDSIGSSILLNVIFYSL